MRYRYLLPAFIAGLSLMALGVSLMPAAANDLQKLQEQALGVTGQLNGNCSATLIYSERDDKSGEVTTVFLTASIA